MTQKKQSVTLDQLRLARLRFLVAHEGLWDPLRKQKENLENQRTFTSSVTKYHKKIAKVYSDSGWKEAMLWRSFSQRTTSSLPQTENRTSDDFRSSSTLAGELLISWASWCFLKKMSKPHVFTKASNFPISDPQVPAHLPQLQAFLWQRVLKPSSLCD